MYSRLARPHLRALLGSALFLAALGASLAGSPATHAVGIICRTDPIVTLSDGTVLRLEATIATDASAVQSIDYTLRAPRGTTIVSVEYDNVIPSDREHLTFVADRDPSRYKTVTRVTVGTNQPAVTVKATIGIHSDSADGHAGDGLGVDLDTR